MVAPQKSAASAAPIENQVLFQSFARLSPRALGISLGAVSGLVLFALTAALVVKGAPAEGAEVGPRLGLLRHYLPGFTVSWPGAFLGLGWGVALGGLLGFVSALLINFHHAVYLRMIERRFRRQGLLDG